MGTRDFDNLVRGVGLTAASGGMNFNDSLPNSPRLAGDSFGSYTLLLNTNALNFDDSTIYDNFRTFTWVANLDSENAPNLLNDLVGKNTSILLGNVFDGENNFKPSGLSITNTSITYGATWVSASFMLTNSSSVVSRPPAGVENAWYEADVSMSHAADPYYNDVQTLSVARVKVYPSYDGQGNPSTPPSLPSAPTVTYPHPSLGADYLRMTVAATWFQLGSTNIEIQWSVVSDFSSTIGFGTEQTFFTANDPNFAQTFYVRARVIAPYVGSYVDSSVYFEDPRPDV
jgi:hypothetical protein